MKKNKYFNLMIVLTVIFASSYIITTPIKAAETYDRLFEYPTIEELNKLNSMEEKYKAADIDKETLNKLSNLELINAVADYPYLFDIYAFDTFDGGYQQVRSRFSGLDELKKRDIFIDKQITESSLMNDEMSMKELTMHRILYLQDYSTSLVASSTVTTPNGTKVSILINNELSAARIKELDNYVRTKYPSVTLLRSASNKYNCHSYAWYSTSSNNSYWMNDPSAYMRDGSYKQKSSSGIISTNYRIYYNGEHSGIVNNSGYVSYNNINIVSKWGQLGLISHKINDCPYSGSISFWSR